MTKQLRSGHVAINAMKAVKQDLEPRVAEMAAGLLSRTFRNSLQADNAEKELAT